jgi:hypothetical protein
LAFSVLSAGSSDNLVTGELNVVADAGNAKNLEGKMRPAHLVTIDGRPAQPEEMFRAAMLFIMQQNKLVETIYQMDKDGRFSGEGEKGLEAKAFLEEQLVKGAQMLGDIWYSAWQQAPPDTFLGRQLARRSRPANNSEKN